MPNVAELDQAWCNMTPSQSPRPEQQKQRNDGASIHGCGDADAAGDAAVTKAKALIQHLK